jgi:putative transposase
MPRIARVIAIGHPHHIVQRGNRRQEVFFKDEDYRKYLKFLSEYSNKNKLLIVAYCLMPNHVHLITIPKNKEGLARAIGETHRNYTRMINFREKWRGYLWQGRFSSYVMDEKYLYSAVKYILNNPVKARIVKSAEEYEWSSVKHHLDIEKIPFINDDVLREMIDNWAVYLKEGVKKEDVETLRKHERTGRPLGDKVFIEKLENKLGISLKKKKPGPKKNKKETN